MPNVVIFSNGELPDPSAASALLQPDDYLIAADGGARHLLQMGLLPHLVIGDLDSVDEDALFQMTSSEVEIEQFPEDKDETDLELALLRAVGMQPDAIFIVGALGGRLDHTIATLSLISAARWAELDIRLDDGVEEAFFCRPPSAKREQVEIQGKSEDIVSLIPWGATVEGIVTEGLQWPLHRETLLAERSRGVSNGMLGNTARITIQSGLLLVIHRRI